MRSPLKTAPARTAGQSLDHQIVDKQFDAVAAFLPALFLLVVAGLEWYKALLNVPPTPILHSLMALGAAGYAFIKFRALRSEVDDYKQGRDGEKTVGAELEKLREQGAHVFHDLCANDFNVDHIVVSPKGVFVVETKTWSKPDKGKANLRFDGQQVIKPDQSTDTKPIEQVKANARYVQTLLKQSTGREFAIQPIVAFPGWFIEKQPRCARFEPWVLNPKVIGGFMKNTKAVLSDEDVCLISHHLTLHIDATQNA